MVGHTSVWAAAFAYNARTSFRQKNPIMTGLTGEKNVLYYGADPTGVADSTAAFNNAFAAGPVVVPFGKYLVSNITVPPRGYVRGNAPLGYVNDTPSGTSSKRRVWCAYLQHQQCLVRHN